jgi:hypothetical protein
MPAVACRHLEDAMITTFELVINAFVVLAVLPLAILSLATGSKPPENTRFTKYYEAEPNLMLTSNLFLLAVSAIAAHKLVLHFGLVDADLGGKLETWIMVPFFALLLLFFFHFVRAILRVRRAEQA